MTSGQDHRRQQQQMSSRQSDLASRIVSTALEHFAATSAAHNASSSSPSSSNVVDVENGSLRRYADVVAAENADVLTLQTQLVLALHALDQMSSEQAQLLDQLRRELDLMSSEGRNISRRQDGSPQEAAAAGNDAAAMTEELERSNLYAATVQIDLVRTRERMNDALSFAKTSATNNTNQINSQDVQDDNINNSNDNEEEKVLLASIASLTMDLKKVREQLNNERSAATAKIDNRSTKKKRGNGNKKHGGALSCNSKNAMEEIDIVAAAPAEETTDATATAVNATTVNQPSPSTSSEAPAIPTTSTAAAAVELTIASEKLDSGEQQQQQRPVLGREGSSRNSFVGIAA